MIYYSHINEDNRVERDLLHSSNCEAIVAICGSGERVISLLDQENCNHVLVVDCNKEELFLLQLKLAGLQQLSVKEYLQFIGHYNCSPPGRLIHYERIKKILDLEAVNFWNDHKQLIKAGILNAGYFEHFLKRIRPMINICLGKNFRHVFEKQYNKERFPVTRWELMKKLFSLKLVYKLTGNMDEAFVGKNANTRLIPQALDDSFRTGKAAACFMSHLVFKGNLQNMDQQCLPPSLREDVLGRIQQRLINKKVSVEFYQSDLLQFLKRMPKSSKVFYSLSDILSFADFNYLQQVLDESRGEENLVVTRSFLRNRITGQQFAQLSHYGALTEYGEKESTGMYQVIAIQS